MSINDKLSELRQLVDGKDSKVLTDLVCLSVCLSVCVLMFVKQVSLCELQVTEVQSEFQK